MPRSADGAYSLPVGTLVNSGDTLLPSQHNPAMSDLAAAVGNSLDRNGSGGMRAALDMGGNWVRNVANATLPQDAVPLAQVQALGVPIGAEMDWPVETPPAGWLLEYGQAVSRTTYASLFAVLGTQYGAGDGSTTFNLPDKRGVVVAGKDNMGGTAAGRLNNTSDGITGNILGASFGLQTHTLVTGQIPSHSHTVNDPGHTHSLGNQLTAGGSGVEAGNGYRFVNANTGASATGVTTANSGGNGAHNNVQPTMVQNKIIFAGTF